MTTTSLIHHKPPPLKTRNDNPVVYLRTNNYYGSVGRPHHGRRKSAVELLQESKAFYVKSESVLDNRQEFKNPEHLHVLPRSPTMGGQGQGQYRERGGSVGPPPSAPPICGPYGAFSYNTYNCPPYPHDHWDHEYLHLMQTNYLNSIKREKHPVPHPGASSKTSKKDHHQSHNQVTAKITIIEGGLSKPPPSQGSGNKTKSSSSRIVIGKEATSNSSGSDRANKAGPKSTGAVEVSQGPMTFTSFSQNGSLYSSLEKQHQQQQQHLPVIPAKSGGSGPGKPRDRTESSESPPPLPPKSPRTTSKPNRPSDFPRSLVLDPNTAGIMLPPPPPRKHRTKSGPTPGDTSTVIRNTKCRKSVTTDPILQPITLPSPILPPTPPPDVVMESPMSDSGPIISPPPAFSTPVTPMLDRQNSSISDKSVGGGGGLPPRASASAQGAQPLAPQGGKAPLSATVSMSGVSSISSRSHSNNEDVSMRCSGSSPRSRSRLSSSSPMSHQDAGEVGIRRRSGSGCGSVFSSNNVSMGHNTSLSNSPSEEEEEEEEDEDSDEDAISADDDDSSRAADEQQQQQQQQQHTKLGRNNSRNSTLSADGGSRSKRSPSRGRRRGGSTGVTITTTTTAPSNGKMSKSITENFLYGAAHKRSSSSNHYMECSQQLSTPPQHTHSSSNSTIKPRIVSPLRRPILRSKSDLSHRYLKASRSSTLAPGFTLVHVDLGPPPPVPLHNSISTYDFHTSGGGTRISGHYQGSTPHSHHNTQHQQQQQQHYHQPVGGPGPHYHTLQPSSHYYSTYPVLHLAPSTIYGKPNPQPSAAYENLKVKGGSGKTELDNFFDGLGQDGASASAPENQRPPKTQRDESESPIFFSSVSSVDSCARKSGSGESEDSPVPPKIIGGARTVGATASGYSPPICGGGGGGGGTSASIVVHHGEPSIVERNARVIKWLFNCRKAAENR